MAKKTTMRWSFALAAAVALAAAAGLAAVVSAAPAAAQTPEPAVAALGAELVEAQEAHLWRVAGWGGASLLAGVEVG